MITIPHKTDSESVREKRVGTVSEWRSPGRAGAIFNARFEVYRESVLSAPQ
jgi:hypothetical protein